MNMKNVLFIIGGLHGGGAEKALVELLANFDYERYHVTLCVVYYSGIYMSQIPEQKYGGAYAAEYVATPGASEHQTGLGIDMTSQSVVDKQRLVFGDTTEYKWVVENCAKYGFIVRFTEGTDGITGISHEPWHLRYVGKKTGRNCLMRFYPHGRLVMSPCNLRS